MKISRSTKDHMIEANFENEEEILTRFDEVRKRANELDAERDRLRKYITDNVEPGTYGDAVLDITGPSAPRVYANSDGNYYLEYGFIAEIDEDRLTLNAGEKYKVLNKEGHVAATVTCMDNTALFTKKGSYTVKTIIGA